MSQLKSQLIAKKIILFCQVRTQMQSRKAAYLITETQIIKNYPNPESLETARRGKAKPIKSRHIREGHPPRNMTHFSSNYPRDSLVHQL